MGKAGNVGIDHDPGFDPEGIPQHHVGGLASDTIEREQGLHRRRHLSPVLFYQHTAAGLDVAGFVAEKADASDVEGQGLEIGLGVVLGGPVFLKQGLGDDVHLFVGALGRKDGGHQQLQRIGELEFTVGLRIGRSKALHQGTDPLPPGRRRLAGHASSFP